MHFLIAAIVVLALTCAGAPAQEDYAKFRAKLEPIGGGARLLIGQTHRVRLEHDGAKTMRVLVDGKETAVVGNVGRLTAGDVMLLVRSSTPVLVSRLSISGVPSPLDPQQVRERYVLGVIAKLWP